MEERKDVWNIYFYFMYEMSRPEKQVKVKINLNTKFFQLHLKTINQWSNIQ
jgi:hypothetical protein